MRPLPVLMRALWRELKVSRTRLLRLYFGFDKWHVYAQTKPSYVDIVHSFANTLQKKDVVLEVGCGLGNLITGCNFSSRIAIDNSSEVIKAAKFLNYFHSKKVMFLHGSFEEALRFENIDCLILVNWIHNLTPIQLENSIREMYGKSLNSNSYIISEGIAHYRNYHNKEFFSKFGEILKESLIDDREVFLIKVTSL